MKRHKLVVPEDLLRMPDIVIDEDILARNNKEVTLLNDTVIPDHVSVLLGDFTCVNAKTKFIHKSWLIEIR